MFFLQGPTGIWTFHLRIAGFIRPITTICMNGLIIKDIAYLTTHTIIDKNRIDRLWQESFVMTVERTIVASRGARFIEAILWTIAEAVIDHCLC